jgi:coenzyme PQQ synthesis protein D (PqqD)
VETYVLKPSIRLAVRDNASVILDPARGKYYSLGSVATAICLALRDRSTVTEILSQIENRFETAGRDPMKDLKLFLDQLIQLQLCVKVS